MAVFGNTYGRNLQLLACHRAGEFISSVRLEPNDISGRELATSLGVATSTLSRVLKGSSAVSPEMALRFPRRWDEPRKAGSPCNINTTFGAPNSMWIWHESARSG